MILQKNQCFIASDRNHVWFEKVTVRLGVSLVTKRKWNEKDQGAPPCASPGSPGAFAPSALLGISSRSGGAGQLHTSLVCVCSGLLPSGVAVRY